MTCSFCITQDGFQVMTEGQVQSMVMALREKDVRNIIFGGGEPLSWPHDLLKMARFAQRQGMFVQVGTNGLAMTENLFNAPEIDRFILPLESVCPLPHNSMRKTQGGHHAIILDRLERLALLGKQVTISTVVTRINRPDLMMLAECLSNYQRGSGHLHAWHLYRMISEGRGGSIYGRELDTGIEEYDRACQEVKGMYPKLKIFKRPDMRKSASVGFFWIHRGKVHSQSPYGTITVPGAMV